MLIVTEEVDAAVAGRIAARTTAIRKRILDEFR
jgi:hypothetical protein